MAEFVMPQLGADMSAGKLLSWRKKVGDRVRRGDIIADVETDKADIEVEVFSTGVIEKILIQPGEKVPVGTVMAIIREEGKPAGAEVPTLPRQVAGPPPPAVAVQRPSPRAAVAPPTGPANGPDSYFACGEESSRLI